MRLGIYGYGNLGRGVECAARQNPDMELTGVENAVNAPDRVRVPLTDAASPERVIFSVRQYRRRVQTI